MGLLPHVRSPHHRLRTHCGGTDPRLPRPQSAARNLGSSHGCRLRSLHSGAKVPADSAASARLVQGGDDSTVLFYAGRLVPEKNLSLLIETIARLDPAIYGLAIAGTGILLDSAAARMRAREVFGTSLFWATSAIANCSPTTMRTPTFSSIRTPANLSGSRRSRPCPPVWRSSLPIPAE